MPNPKMTPQQLADAETAARAVLQQLQQLQAAMGGPPPRPRSMTADQFEAHVEAAEAETAKNAEYDADPRAYVFALEQRLEKIEALAAPPATSSAAASSSSSSAPPVIVTDPPAKN